MLHTFRYQTDGLFLSQNLTEVPIPDAYRMHTHQDIEIYYFVRGKGTFHIEGSAYPLESGDLLVMYPSESHYIELNCGYPYERKVLNFSPDLFSSIDPDGILTKAILMRKPGMFNRYKSSDFQNGSCLHYFNSMMSEDGDVKTNILAGLMALLNELYHIHSKRFIETESEPESVEHRIIRYINNNLETPITLDSICQNCFISKSQLCRLFKKATGTTVWQYITTKRLVAAQQLLSSGEVPTKVCSLCGFNDYSSFYRAYVKHFGCSPTQKD